MFKGQRAGNPKFFAIKTYETRDPNQSASHIRMLEVEEKLLKYLREKEVPTPECYGIGEGILQVRNETGAFKEAKVHYIISEHVGNGSLFDFIRSHASFPVEIVKNIFKEICVALDSLHQAGVAHLDLKLDNIIVNDKGEVILIDFGRSMKTPDGCVPPLKSNACSPPEMGYDKITESMGPENYINGYKADIFATGALLFSLVYRYPYYYANQEYPEELRDYTFEEYWKRKCNEREEIKDSYDELLASLLNRMLSLNPIERPSISEILAHPWLHDLSHPMASKEEVIKAILTRREQISKK